MSDDLISRQAAIDALAKNMPSLTTPDGTGQFDHDIQVTDEAYVDCMQIIHDLPSTSPHWIPVSERLPIIENNFSARVLITTSWGLVKEAYYSEDHWEIDDIPYKLTSVSAWMPLPKPWEGEDNG